MLPHEQDRVECVAKAPKIFALTLGEFHAQNCSALKPKAVGLMNLIPGAGSRIRT